MSDDQLASELMDLAEGIGLSAARDVSARRALKFKVAVTLDVDDDRLSTEFDADYQAQEMFLAGLRDNVGPGVKLRDARIVDGLVDQDGVVVSSDKGRVDI